MGKILYKKVEILRTDTKTDGHLPVYFEEYYSTVKDSCFLLTGVGGAPPTKPKLPIFFFSFPEPIDSLVIFSRAYMLL